MRAYHVASVIEKLANDADKKLSETEGVQAYLRSQQVTIQSQIRSAYRNMARLFMQEPSDISEQQNIQHAVDQLHQDVQTTRDNLAHSQLTLEKQQNERLSLQEQIEKLHAELARLKDTTPEIKQAFEGIAQQQNTYDAFEHDHRELVKEIVDKKKEYTQSRPFMFLLHKKYAQPDYRAWPVIRNLDNWLARTVHFKENVANYQMLSTLLTASERRLNTAKIDLEERSLRCKAQQKEIEDRLGLTGLYQQEKDCQDNINISAQLTAELQKKLSEYAHGEGPLFTSITTQLSQQLAKMPNDQLELMVSKTPSPEDDRLLEKVRQLKYKEQEIDEQLRDHKHHYLELHTHALRAKRLTTAFYREDFDDTDLKFNWDDNVSPEELFNSYILGEIDLDHVLLYLYTIAEWEQETYSVDVPTHNRSGSRSRSWSSPSFGGFSSSSSSSGGFRTSSSSGGGGFRTTDSF